MLWGYAKSCLGDASATGSAMQLVLPNPTTLAIPATAGLVHSQISGSSFLSYCTRFVDYHSPRQGCSNPAQITIFQTFLVVIAEGAHAVRWGVDQCPGCCNGKTSLVSSTNCSPCSQQLRRRRSPKSLRITFSARSHVWGAMPAECEFDRRRRIARQ